MVEVIQSFHNSSHLPPAKDVATAQEASAPPPHNYSKPFLQPPRPQFFSAACPKPTFSTERVLWKTAETDMRAQLESAACDESDLQNYHTESDRIYKEKIEKIQATAKAQKQAASWSLSNQVFSWMTSFTGIVAGIALIATGVGAVAGSLILIGGLLQLTSQILQITGVWEKIATKLLPGNGSDEQKRAVMTWIQLAVAFFSIVMAGAGGIIAGWGAASQAMGAGNSALGSVIACGFGVTSIGLGIKDSEFKQWVAWIKKLEIQKEKVRQLQESSTERFHERMEASGKDYGILTWTLDTMNQVNAAYQRAWR